MIAETDRLSIRLLTLRDTPQLAVHLANPEVMHRSIRGVLTEDQTREFIEWCIGLYASHGFGPWALTERSSSALVGFCGLSPESVEGKQIVHLGYRLGRQFWGQGLATEAVAKTLALAFERFGLGSVVAIIEPDHVASVRVAEKAGFCSFVCTEFHGRQVRLYRKESSANKRTIYKSRHDELRKSTGAS